MKTETLFPASTELTSVMVVPGAQFADGLNTVWTVESPFKTPGYWTCREMENGTTRKFHADDIAASLVRGFVDARRMHALNIACGVTDVGFTRWVNALKLLGYKLNDACRCDGTAKMLTGPLAGFNYPSRSYGLKHIASGLSAFHVDCPRDNWERVRTLRNTTVLSKNGRWIVSV